MEYYRDAPLIVRFVKLYLMRVVLVLCAAALVIGIPIAISTAAPYLKMGLALLKAKDREISQEEIYRQSPLDDEGAAAIEALPEGSPDDTWAVYIYMVGSDLEDQYQNSLSELVRESSKELREEQNERIQNMKSDLLKNYLTVLDDNGIEPPLFLYEPKDYIEPAKTKPKEYSESSHGSGTLDLDEMCTDESGNVEIVIQTGGARKWESPRINPNRTQRFCIKDGLVNEEQDLPLERSSDPDTLSDFLAFCKTEHPADHTILVLWDHGAGAFGYGKDNIFGGALSIADIRSAISKVYTPDMISPPFDVIGYDACLMGNLDVMHSLEGLARYYVFNICEDESIQALYFYKTAGCLTDDMKAYVRTLTYNEPETLNTSLFKKFEKAVPVIDGSNFTIPVDPVLQDMITSYYIVQVSLSEDMSEMVYYGTDELADIDGDGNITSGRYDGKWICLDDEPLSPEIVSSSPSSVEYRAKVLKDGIPVYLMFSYERASGEFTINGTKPYTEEDSEYEFINMRVNSESIVDSKIVPIYEAADDDPVTEYEIEGKAVKCTKKTKITRKALDDSTYAVFVVIDDQRGDEYGSDVLFCDISDGGIKKLYTSDEFYKKLEEEGKM